jgi:hypothetical protein
MPERAGRRAMSLAVMLTAGLMGLPMTGSNHDVGGLLFTRVRSTEAYMIGLIREGYDRLSTFRELVDFLQHTNVIVSIHRVPCAGGRIRSCLVAVKGSRQERHIWIKVDPQHTIRDWLIATTAHELQHAVEIAENPGVIDRTSLLELYRGIAVGRCGQGLSEECETPRALATERQVLGELSENRSRSK